MDSRNDISKLKAVLSIIFPLSSDIIISFIEKIKLYAASFPITTPFGTPVVPDVYKTYETSSSNKGRCV